VDFAKRGSLRGRARSPRPRTGSAKALADGGPMLVEVMLDRAFKPV